MNSRDEILKAVRANKPNGNPLPDINPSIDRTGDLQLRYRAALEKNGGKLRHFKSQNEIEAFIKEQFPAASQVCSLVDFVPGNVDPAKIVDAHDLNTIDVAIVKAVLGVAENAALWIPESAVVHRALPFITQHLVIVLSPEDIVANMHEAYNGIKVNEDGFGVFIAGPSKTADIEQSLVIGAHGARSLWVLVG